MNEQEIAARRYIPKDYKLLNISEYAPNGVDLLFYTNQDQTSAICYTKKSFNHTWYYRFNNTERLFLKVKETIANRLERQAAVKAQRKERFKPHKLNVGDVLYCSWGYDQTNIDFYKVLEKIGKNKVKIIRLNNAFNQIDSEYGQDKVSAGSIKEGAEPMIKVVNSLYNSVSVYSFASASLWDGQPLYQTNSHFGH